MYSLSLPSFLANLICRIMYFREKRCSSWAFQGGIYLFGARKVRSKDYGSKFCGYSLFLICWGA